MHTILSVLSYFRWIFTVISIQLARLSNLDRSYVFIKQKCDNSSSIAAVPTEVVVVLTMYYAIRFNLRPGQFQLTT